MYMMSKVLHVAAHAPPAKLSLKVPSEWLTIAQVLPTTSALWPMMSRVLH